MKNSTSTNSQTSLNSETPQDKGFFLWQLLKSKRICYLTLPLIIMATLTEFVILATGWRYQQRVCLPQGMGVIFFGIGPIGATILAVELLKLPLAIWTASRRGWQKGFMLLLGLPLICVLTFQLVKDMAVYEMGVAMTPASQMLGKAGEEEIKASQLNGELTAIEEKRADRERKLAELTAKKAKAKAELEESLKHNQDTRQDAISLTEYQKKELSEVEARQATIIKQFDADTEQLTKAIADLRAQRETELARATTWNAAEARIDNAYKTKMGDYANKKAAYEKDKADYDNANFLKRPFMRKPVDPGVPPERESNTILKPTLVAELETQIKAKEAELAAVNTKRRERVAQVGDDARRLREDFDRRSGTKREETDHKREELLAAQAALATQFTAEEKQIDQEFAAAAQKVDGIRAEIDACRKRAEGLYEAREASIKNTQVHRIATTVEIVRGLLMGKRPVSITASAKERGDLYTDQISMVRVWVYPVLAFLVAFLPTLMVEIGFSTIFEPEQQRPPHRLGFFGRRLHWLYTRAGRQKILRAERMAREVSTEIAVRDNALAAAQATAKQALAEKEVELQAARDAMTTASAKREDELKKKEQEWVAKFTDLADSLNKAIIEKDALRDLQKSEIERQIQMRQNAWSDRLTQLRQELDDQRAASETERTTLIQEHHKKLMELSEDCKTQIIQLRRQMADAELASVEASAKLAHDLKDALSARDAAESQLQHQADTFALQLSQAKEDATREMEKVARQEKYRLERQQLEFEKALRQRAENFEHRLKQREQELSLAFEARLVEEKTRVEQDARRREAELERQLESRGRETDARWKQEAQQREEAAQIRLKQQEQQLQAQAEIRISAMQTEAEKALRQRDEDFEHRLKQRDQELSLAFDARLAEEKAKVEQDAHRREAELEGQLEVRLRDVDARWSQQVQQLEETAQTRLKKREQQLQGQSEARISEMQTEAKEELRRRELELERQLDLQSREAEARLTHELQQKEIAFHAKLKQREQELTTRAATLESELQNQWAADLRARQEEWAKQTEARVRAAERALSHEAQQKEESLQTKIRQREQQLQSQFDARQAELRAEWDQDLRSREQEWERNAEASARAIESRLMAEMQAKEELFQSKSRQRDQQWQVKLDTVRVELQAQTEQELRRRAIELAEAKQREQELVARLAVQAEAHQMVNKEWETELGKMRNTIEPLEALLARTEKERDEAKQAASESTFQVREFEKKLTEASSLLTGWKSGNAKHLVGAQNGRNGS